MNTTNLFNAAFFMSLGFTFFGVYRKIMHAPGAETVMIFALLFSLIYVITGIIEVNRSRHIPWTEKTMWIVGFLLMSSITAIVYLISGRKRVLDTN